MRDLLENEVLVIVKFDHTDGPAVGETADGDEDAEEVGAADWDDVYQAWVLAVEEGGDVQVEDSVFTVSVESASDLDTLDEYLSTPP